MMKSLRHALLIPYDFVVFYLGLAMFGLAALLWSLASVPLHPLLPARLGTRVGRAAIMLIFRGFLGFLQLSGRFHFDLRALDALRHEKSLIIAPNHPSLWDAVLVVSRLPDVVCVMKAQIISNIFVGAGARMARYIRNASLRQMILQAVAELRHGNRVLLFPEGTRTVCAPVDPFTGSLGVIACRAGSMVQTVFIETDSAFLTKGWPVYKKPQLPLTYRIRLGRRFAPAADGASLTAELEHYFRSEMAGPDSPVPAMKPTAARVAAPADEPLSIP